MKTHIEYRRTQQDGTYAYATFHFEGNRDGALAAFEREIELGDSKELVVTDVTEDDDATPTDS